MAPRLDGHARQGTRQEEASLQQADAFNDQEGAVPWHRDCQADICSLDDSVESSK